MQKCALGGIQRFNAFMYINPFLPWYYILMPNAISIYYTALANYMYNYNILITT